MSIELIPGLEGIPAANSSISYIDGHVGILEYRGYDIATLADNCSFEEASYLLLNGELPTRSQLDTWHDELSHHRRLKYRIIDMLKCLPDHGHPMKALQSGVAALGAFYPVHNIGDEEQAHLSIVRLVAKLPTLVAAFSRMRSGDDPIRPRDDLTHAQNFLYMLDEQVPDPVVAHTMDVALILHMEHTMNASTFTGRVVSSTMADPYAVVSSALGSLTGPLHGGANERALAQLRQIPGPAAVDEIIGAKIENKEKIMGMGHRVYKTKDPRATILQGLAGQLFGSQGATPVYEVAKRVEEYTVARLGHKGIYPNVDFYSGIVYDRMGISTDLFTPIFAIARVVGWLAHWREQLVGNRIFRPTQIYQGARERSFIPSSDR